MSSPPPIRLRTLRASRVAALAMLGLAASASAQISISSAVGLALRGNPRVQMAQADVARANAQLSQARDVYMPSVTAGAGLGQSYGYSPYPPTLFTTNGGSLVYNQAQFAYIRSARAGLKAAQLALQDTSEAVAEDAATAFLNLDHDQKREQVIRQQSEYAATLVNIVQQRLDAGQDSEIGLTQAKLTAAQMRLALLRAQDDTANDRDHLARLIGLPPTSLTVDGVFPTAPLPAAGSGAGDSGYANAAVASAFANADARRQQAVGDSHFLYRPQINLILQYQRYATFTDSFKQLEQINCNNNPNCVNGGANSIGANEELFGVQITIPLFDRFHQAKSRESAAEAAHALHEAENAQFQGLEGQSKLRHTITQLEARADVLALEQQLSQQQLEVVRLQLQSGNPGGPQMTPKDEQNARIAEREKYLAVVDSSFQLRQTQIQLLRQTGQLEAWLKSAAVPPATLPPAPPPQP